MNDARGWIPSVGFGLHSAYLLAVALSILSAPALRRVTSSHALATFGLGLLVVGSLLNGLDLHASYDIAVFGRVVAGFGAGQAMAAAPRLLPVARPGAVDLFEILLPALGPPVIALASMAYALNGSTYAVTLTPQDQLDVQIQLQLLAQVPAGSTISWEIVENVFLTWQLADLQALQAAGVAHVKAVYAHAADLVGQINAAPDAAACLAIDVAAGWPA